MKTIGIFLILLISSYFFTFNNSSELPIEETNPIISVVVDGAIDKPGTYQLEIPSMSSLFEQLNLKAEADCTCISMERVLLDQDIIYIPTTNQTKVSLNNGTIEQLQTIKGIGESKANKIIEYRKNQTFTSIEDVMKISGVGYKTYLKWRDYLCL